MSDYPFRPLFPPKEVRSDKEKMKARLDDLEELVLCLADICSEMWGGDGTWQRIWDRPKQIIEEIKNENNR